MTALHATALHTTALHCSTPHPSPLTPLSPRPPPTQVFNDLQPILEYALYPTASFGVVLCLYEALHLKSTSGTIVSAIGLVAMCVALMGPEIFPDLVEYLRSEDDDDDDDTIQRQWVDYQKATDYNIVAVFLATTLMTIAIALGRGDKRAADMALAQAANSSSAATMQAVGPLILNMGDAIIIPCTFMAFSTFSAITCLVSPIVRARRSVATDVCAQTFCR